MLEFPFNVTRCGLLGAELVIVNVAVSGPEFWRYHVTVAVQLAPGATASQLLVCWNLPLEIDACMNWTVLPVLFVYVTFRLAVFPLKVSDVALCVTTPAVDGVSVVGEAERVSVTRCGLLGALLVIVKVAVSEPEFDA